MSSIFLLGCDFPLIFSLLSLQNECTIKTQSISVTFPKCAVSVPASFVALARAQISWKKKKIKISSWLSPQRNSRLKVVEWGQIKHQICCQQINVLKRLLWVTLFRFSSKWGWLILMVASDLHSIALCNVGKYRFFFLIEVTCYTFLYQKIRGLRGEKPIRQKASCLC